MALTTRVAIRTCAEPTLGALGGKSGHATMPVSMPAAGPLVDGFGRIHSDLRISVTDRCNLRCTYCMPADGMTFLPRTDILTYEELARIARIARTLGVDRVRISGGEPLMRRGLSSFVAMIADIGFDDIALTTNGTMLASQAEALVAAGLTRVNVSCDSLDHAKFASIRRGGDLAVVLQAMDVATSAGLGPVKVNVVVQRGVNDDEIVDFATYARDTGRPVRFIEYMPLDAAGRWSRGDVVPSAEVISAISNRWPLTPAIDEDDPHAPASRFLFDDGGGEIGVVASVTQPFCGSCNRLRITADGAVRNCLFARSEAPLRDAIRSGEGDIDVIIEDALRCAVWAKAAGHGIGDPAFLRPRRTMSMIGG